MTRARYVGCLPADYVVDGGNDDDGDDDDGNDDDGDGGSAASLPPTPVHGTPTLCSQPMCGF